MGNKKTAIADGMVCVRLCREMDSDNISAPCFSPKGLVMLSAALHWHQVSRQSSLVKAGCPDSTKTVTLGSTSATRVVIPDPVGPKSIISDLNPT